MTKGNIVGIELYNKKLYKTTYGVYGLLWDRINLSIDIKKPGAVCSCSILQTGAITVGWTLIININVLNLNSTFIQVN